MATATANAKVVRTRFPRAARDAGKWATLPGRFLDSCGRIAWFAVQAVGQIGHAMRFYRKEIVRLIAEIGMGAGAMAVVARSTQRKSYRGARKQTSVFE
mgnify:CR=1 FL=1